ncbi:MAG: 30S ribosomal protein S3, partial [Phycisphaerae bacterium]
MKMRCESVMQAGAQGVKIICKGRLGGAEMSRSERKSRGSIPLQTLQANVDYGYAVSRTTYGALGVRVWIHHGRYGEETTTDEAVSPRSRMARRRL